MALGTYSSQISGGSTTWLSQSKIGKSLVTMGDLRGAHCHRESWPSAAPLSAKRLDHAARGVDADGGDEDRQVDAGAAKRRELFPAARHRAREAHGVEDPVTQGGAATPFSISSASDANPLARNSR